MHDGDNYFIYGIYQIISAYWTIYLYMISIKSSRLSEPYVPIKWLPLTNSWNFWNYSLTDIFKHFNCISITISLNIAS